MTYVALLRGINVGGKNITKMTALKACLANAGFDCVETFIQTGDVLFDTRDVSENPVVDCGPRQVNRNESMDS
jgi:uncharacterized protein (DUF1697 family)